VLPSLQFFRTTPDDLVARPPLGSSLQSFESCLFLIALMRYPHALTTCVAAIESALKARLEHSEQRTRFQHLLAVARQDFPGLATLPQTQLDDLRQLRNRIVHMGFHSSDDSVAASALLSTGVPFLISVYEVVFGFSLCTALVPPFGEQLRTAIDVFGRAQPTTTGSIEALSVLGHLTRWSLRDSMLGPWELQALDPTESYDLQLEITARLRGHAERQLEPAWFFDCPVCGGPETLVCKLDDDLLIQKTIELLACFCVECGLRLSASARSLLNAVCAEAIKVSRDAILTEFGID
jgi:hypothetical protein